MVDVICRGCAGRYHEITPAFDPEKLPRGDMFKLKALYRKNGWASFPEHEGVWGDAICCPQCESPYSDVTGKVKLDENQLAQHGAPKIPTAQEAQDAAIKALHLDGKKPGEIAKVLNMGHHMNVINRLKVMGLYG